MASIISPKAEVSPKAKIGDNCKIYPFAYIEDDVVIGDNCTILCLIKISESKRQEARMYDVFCLKKKNIKDR